MLISSILNTCFVSVKGASLISKDEQKRPHDHEFNT